MSEGKRGVSMVGRWERERPPNKPLPQVLDTDRGHPINPSLSPSLPPLPACSLACTVQKVI